MENFINGNVLLSWMDVKLRPYAGMLFPSDLQVDGLIGVMKDTVGEMPYKDEIFKNLQRELESLPTNVDEITRKQEAIQYFMDHPQERRTVLQLEEMAETSRMPLVVPETVKDFGYDKFKEGVDKTITRLRSTRELSTDIAWLYDDTLPENIRATVYQAFFNSQDPTLERICESTNQEWKTVAHISEELVPRTSADAMGASTLGYFAPQITSAISDPEEAFAVGALSIMAVAYLGYKYVRSIISGNRLLPKPHNEEIEYSLIVTNQETGDESLLNFRITEEEYREVFSSIQKAHGLNRGIWKYEITGGKVKEVERKRYRDSSGYVYVKRMEFGVEAESL